MKERFINLLNSKKLRTVVGSVLVGSVLTGLGIGVKKHSDKKTGLKEGYDEENIHMVNDDGLKFDDEPTN